MLSSWILSVFISQPTLITQQLHTSFTTHCNDHCTFPSLPKIFYFCLFCSLNVRLHCTWSIYQNGTLFLLIACKMVLFPKESNSGSCLFIHISNEFKSFCCLQSSQFKQQQKQLYVLCIDRKICLSFLFHISLTLST